MKLSKAMQEVLTRMAEFNHLPWFTRSATIRVLVQRGLMELSAAGYILTPAGREAAKTPETGGES